MKTYSDRTENILKKVKIQKRNRRRVHLSVSCIALVCVLSLLAPIFTPYDTNLPSIEQYAASEYYNVIDKINRFTYQPPKYANAWEEHVLGAFQNIEDKLNMNAEQSVPASTQEENVLESSQTPMPGGDGVYEEVTDNQVEGVIEADIIKRSSQYIFYLRGVELWAYSIEGADSKALGMIPILGADDFDVTMYKSSWEMFLSEDCSTITIVASAFDTYDKMNKCVVLINIDVTDPTNMIETGRTYLTGDYLSTRLVDGKFLLMSNYRVPTNNIDFDNPSTFVPRYGTIDNMQCVEGANIVCPDALNNTQYTTICLIDGKSLELLSSGAFLSFSTEVYVSENKIYATREYLKTTKISEEDDYIKCRREIFTDISALDYSTGTLTPAGSVTVSGTINDQYSMDEYQGMLRVVTTTSVSYFNEYRNDSNAAYLPDVMPSDDVISTIDESDRGTNASLYIFDLATMEPINSIKHFAPMGESVQSVRFDGTDAYVCTAIVVTMTDPVFHFDLTDPTNIVMKDTGTITGYSTSLVNFGDYLLGIGYSEARELKLEVYVESAYGVDSVATYILPCDFSTDYKSYYINRKEMQIGLGVYEFGGLFPQPDCYLLLQFDGYGFIELLNVPLTGSNSQKRGIAIDDYFYLFGAQEFTVVPLP